LWVVEFGQGKSALAASLALGCLMLPIVVRSSEEMLRLVPNTLREGSAALGSRTWRTTLGVVLPTALPGLVSGAMLAVARAAAEVDEIEPTDAADAVAGEELVDLRELTHADPAPASATTVFDVDRLSVYYGSFRAVRDVSLDVVKNDITAFIGPSGCGKTTVL